MEGAKLSETKKKRASYEGKIMIQILEERREAFRRRCLSSLPVVKVVDLNPKVCSFSFSLSVANAFSLSKLYSVLGRGELGVFPGEQGAVKHHKSLLSKWSRRVAADSPAPIRCCMPCCVLVVWVVVDVFSLARGWALEWR